MMKRRIFIKKSGLLLGGMGILPQCSFISSGKKKKLGVCLVGLGNYSKNLLAPALQLTEHCQLTGIVTGSPSKIPLWQKKYDIPDKNVYDYQNMDRIADNPDIDVIYIVLPTGLHSEYAIKAANTGKHVWCEKPMAKTVVECQAIIDACAKNKVKLSIGYRMQHEPNTQQIIEWAKTKPFGAIKKVRADIGYNISNQSSWRMSKKLGGGLLYDLGVYPINAMRYVTGEEPLSVIGQHETRRTDIFIEVPEITTFTLEFPKGIKATGKTSAAERVNILYADCENGWYELQPFQEYNGVKGKASDGRLLNVKIENQQARQMDNDALAIIEDSLVLVPGLNGMKDIAIVEAINESADTGEMVRLSKR